MGTGPSSNGSNGNGSHEPHSHANGSNGHGPSSALTIPPPHPNGGRPTEYRPEYCDALLAWFDGPRTERVIKKRRVIPQKAGPPAEEVEYETLGLALPTLEGFASSIGYTSKCLRGWAKNFADFGVAFARARELQKDWLVELATRNLISAGTYSYTMSNISDWRADPAPPANAERKAIFFFDPMKDSRAIPQPTEEAQSRVSG